jgi:hypothetical protein
MRMAQIMELLQKCGLASVIDVAESLLIHVRFHIEYYRKRVEFLAGRVLTKKRKIAEEHKHDDICKRS